MGLDISLYLTRTTETDTEKLNDNLKKIVKNETGDTIEFLPLGDFRKCYTLHEAMDKYFQGYENCSYRFIDMTKFIEIAKQVIEADKDDYEKSFDKRLKEIVEVLEAEERNSRDYDIAYWAWW